MIPVGHKTKTNLREPEAADIKVKSLKQFIKVVSDQMFCRKTDNKEFRLFFHQKHLRLVETIFSFKKMNISWIWTDLNDVFCEVVL